MMKLKSKLSTLYRDLWSLFMSEKIQKSSEFLVKMDFYV